MTSLAMSFFTVDRSQTNTSHYIFFLRNRFKVIRIHAKLVSAKMIYLISYFYFPLGKFIGKSMRTYHFIKISKISILAIFSTAYSSNPIPTGVSFFNVFKKSFFCFNHNAKYNKGDDDVNPILIGR